MFQCGPYKSELDATLSEKQMHFLAPTPCCCSPRKSPIIYGRAAARNQPGHFGNCWGAICPAHHLWFFWFILACQGAVEEEAFSLYLLCSSTAQAASGPHCYNRLAASARNLHPFFSLVRLISPIMFIFFSYSTFLPCPKQLISGRSLGIMKIWLWSWLWNGLDILQRFVPLLRHSWGPCLPAWQQPQDPCPRIPFHL